MNKVFCDWTVPQSDDLSFAHFEGEVFVVDTLTARTSLAEIAQLPVVGFDTESRPSFRRGESTPWPHQFATASRRG